MAECDPACITATCREPDDPSPGRSPFGVGKFWPDLLQTPCGHGFMSYFCISLCGASASQFCLGRVTPAPPGAQTQAGSPALPKGSAPSHSVGLDLYKPLTINGSSVASSCLGMTGMEARPAAVSVGLGYFGCQTPYGKRCSHLLHSPQLRGAVSRRAEILALFPPGCRH